MRHLAVVLGALALGSPALAQVPPYPSTFKTETIAANGTDIFVRVGGKGPAVVLLHGFGETGDMWSPLAKALAADHTVIVPDLRGMGLSSHPADGYSKANQARDIAAVLAKLKIARFDLVTHDIGNMVGFALATQKPEQVTRFVLLDAPVPGVGPWDDILKGPLLWHFRFGGADMERLVAGRERIYLDRFWNEFSADPKRFDEASRKHYAALYARPGAMHSGFAQFAAFDQDVLDNRAWLATGARLKMPVLAIGGEKSFGPMMAVVMRAAASDVTEAVVANSGHWIMEEQPAKAVALIDAFLDGQSSHAELRLTPQEIAALTKGGAGAGTSGVPGIVTTTLFGDPAKAGPYTLEISVPPHTRIAAHDHRDDRTAVVISGEWFFGYGNVASDAAVKALTPGSFYTEPGNVAHFAMTKDKPAVVYISGSGPTDTTYVAAAAPAK